MLRFARQHFFAMAAFLTFAATTSAYADPAPLTDAEAALLVEQLFNANDMPVPTGHFTIVRNGFGGGGKDQMSEAGYNNFLALQRAGVVTLHEDAGSSAFRQGQSFSWGQLLDQTTGGVLMTIEVAPTPAAQSMIDSSGNIKFHPGSFHVTNVAANESKSKGVDYYRVVDVEYSAKWTPLWKQYMAALGDPMQDDRKAIVLFKYDPFKAKWKPIASDMANADQDFRTNQVAQALQ